MHIASDLVTYHLLKFFSKQSSYVFFSLEDPISELNEHMSLAQHTWKKI